MVCDASISGVEIGPLVIIDRRWNAHDEQVAVGEIGGLGRKAQTLSFVELFGADFKRASRDRP